MRVKRPRRRQRVLPFCLAQRPKRRFGGRTRRPPYSHGGQQTALGRRARANRLAAGVAKFGLDAHAFGQLVQRAVPPTASSRDQRTAQGPKCPSAPASPSCQSTRPVGGRKSGHRLARKIGRRAAMSSFAKPPAHAHGAARRRRGTRRPSGCAASRGTISAWRTAISRRYQSSHSACFG